MKTRIAILDLAVGISVALGQATQLKVISPDPADFHILKEGEVEAKRLVTENAALRQQAADLLAANILSLTRQYAILKNQIPPASPATTKPASITEDLQAKISQIADDAPIISVPADRHIYIGGGAIYTSGGNFSLLTEEGQRRYNEWILKDLIEENAKLHATVDQQTALSKSLSDPPPTTQKASSTPATTPKSP